jgi:hypothetical protein
LEQVSLGRRVHEWLVPALIQKVAAVVFGGVGFALAAGWICRSTILQRIGSGV